MNHHNLRAAGFTLVVLLTFCGAAMSTIAVADEVPDAVKASPDVYKVIVENDSVRLVSALINRANVT